jgi:hypothetical protein
VAQGGGNSHYLNQIRVSLSGVKQSRADRGAPPNEIAASRFALLATTAKHQAWLRRALTLADFNWPQAARMSRPRGVRTGAE